MGDTKEYLQAIIKLIDFKIESTNRDNERRLRQFKASQNLQIMDLKEILGNLTNILNNLSQEEE
tara:strand:+ start:1237 stop:1428 length:192 start_codon:yes stop_codon:yes gene_type:complete